MSRTALQAFALTVALSATGCYRMTIISGQAPAPAPKVEDRWRSATIVDAVEIDAPLPLDIECKESGGAWAKIEQKRTPLDWIVDVFLAGAVYESTHVDVYCAKVAPTPAPSSTPSPVAPAGTPAPAPL